MIFAQTLLGARRLLALCGAFTDFRHAVSSAALLLLIFGLMAHAGRAEARGLRLTLSAALPPMARRAAFVAAGTGWSVLLALLASTVMTFDR